MKYINGIWNSTQFMECFNLFIRASERCDLCRTSWTISSLQPVRLLICSCQYNAFTKICRLKWKYCNSQKVDYAEVELVVAKKGYIDPAECLASGDKNDQITDGAYCETKTVDLRKAKRFLVRLIFSSASAAFSWTPRTISSGAFSMNWREHIL